MLIADFEKDLSAAQSKMRTVEEKYFDGKINEDTYQRWVKELTTTISQLRAKIMRLGHNQSDLYRKMYGVGVRPPHRPEICLQVFEC